MSSKPWNKCGCIPKTFLKKCDNYLDKQRYDQTYSYENQWLSSFRAFRDEKELTKEMVAALIETVELYADRSIQINFKFKDEYEELLDYLNTIEDEVKPDEQECLSSYVH